MLTLHFKSSCLFFKTCPNAFCSVKASLEPQNQFYFLLRSHRICAPLSQDLLKFTTAYSLHICLTWNTPEEVLFTSESPALSLEASTMNAFCIKKESNISENPQSSNSNHLENMQLLLINFLYFGFWAYCIWQMNKATEKLGCPIWVKSSVQNFGGVCCFAITIRGELLSCR